MYFMYLCYFMLKEYTVILYLCDWYFHKKLKKDAFSILLIIYMTKYMSGEHLIQN